MESGSRCCCARSSTRCCSKHRIQSSPDMGGRHEEKSQDRPEGVLLASSGRAARREGTCPKAATSKLRW
eukprot:754333-Hanusia_phi.AAC.5